MVTLGVPNGQVNVARDALALGQSLVHVVAAAGQQSGRDRRLVAAAATRASMWGCRAWQAPRRPRRLRR